VRNRACSLACSYVIADAWIVIISRATIAAIRESGEICKSLFIIGILF
jgi:hypothetical protein